MKIRIAILEEDKLYSERLMSHFGRYYADKLEVYTYSQVSNFEEAFQTIHFDILLASGPFASGLPQLPEYMGLIYLVEQNDIEKIEDVAAVGKYQKPEVIYRQILGIYSSKVEKKFSKKNVNNTECRLYLVTAANGGAGASTVAVSLSKYLAQQGKKVLYISLEKNGAQDIFFEGPRKQGFSDIIYLLKSKKANIALRAESIVQRDLSGVYYFEQCRSILDMEELNKEDTKNLIHEICMLGDYEYVVIDLNMRFTESHLYIAECSDAIITVSDGSTIGIEKLRQFVEAVEITDKQKEKNLKARINLIYNRFSSKTGVMYQDQSIPVVGGIQKYEGIPEKEVVNQILTKQIFQKYI